MIVGIYCNLIIVYAYMIGFLFIIAPVPAERITYGPFNKTVLIAICAGVGVIILLILIASLIVYDRTHKESRKGE